MPKPKAKKVGLPAPIPETPKTGTALTSWRQRAMQSINASKQALAKLPQIAGNFLSFRGGNITFGGIKQQNPLPVILLAHGYERTYYSRPFDPNVPASPDCYSYDGNVPHEKSPVPQSDTCAQCRFNQFGSSTNGRGKGCKEGSRMVLLHADHVKAGAEAIATAPLMQGRLSVLNAQTFRNFAEAVFTDEPTWTKLTQISNEPDEKSQYAVDFNAYELEGKNRDAALDAIAARVDEADRLLLQPYQEIEATQQTPAAAPRKRKF